MLIGGWLIYTFFVPLCMFAAILLGARHGYGSYRDTLEPYEQVRDIEYNRIIQKANTPTRLHPIIDERCDREGEDIYRPPDHQAPKQKLFTPEQIAQLYLNRRKN